MTSTYLNLIGGEWTKATTGRIIEDINPADTRDVIGQFQASSREDVEQAIKVASEAQQKWADTPAPSRGKILFKVAQLIEAGAGELARELTREEGKTLKESMGEVTRSIDLFRFYGSQGSRLNGKTLASEDRKQLLYTMKSPIGVVSIITPWNFPLVIPSWKIAPALVSGNAVVFKPASLTPMIALKLIELLTEAGLPKGVVNYVTGSGSDVGEAMVRNSNVAAVSFTGSCGVGSDIEQSSRSGAHKPRVQLEMGGKNPTIVLADAKLDEAVSIVSTAAFGVTGQACTATSRAIVEESIHDEFVSKIVDRANAIRVGNGTSPEVEMGPAVSKAELEKDLDYIRIGREEGARLRGGGEVLKGETYDRGWFISPTVFSDVAPEMRIAKEEIFGPVLSIMSVRNFEDAIEVANGVDFGLSAAICTRDLAKALEFAERIQAGVVKVNRTTTGAVANAPFGGMKRSSSDNFKEMGEEAIEFYTRTKAVYLGF